VITLACSRCGRPLKNASPDGYGPKCRRLTGGTKPKRKRADPTRDRFTRDLFDPEVMNG